MINPLLVFTGGAAVGGWLMDKLGGLVGTASKITRSVVPVYEDRVTVEVHGQPGANMQELYYLALAAANGVIFKARSLTLVNNPALTPPAALIQVELDHASNWIRCTLMFRMGIPLSLNVFRDGVDAPEDFYNNMTVYRGPMCKVVGGPMQFVSPDIPGIPSSSKGNGPTLPWEYQTIVNRCPTSTTPSPPPMTQNPVPHYDANPGPTIVSPNPKPPGDNRSRGVVPAAPKDGERERDPKTGFYKPEKGPGKCCNKTMSLVELVFASLTDPGSAAQEQWAGPTPGPTGG